MPIPRKILPLNLEAELLKEQPELDDTPLPFGKYKGYTPTQIFDLESSYIIWMYENLEEPPCSFDLYSDAVDDQEESRFSW